MQVASVPLSLVSTQAPLISRSKRSVKLLFLQKAAAVVVIVEFKTTRTEGRGVCTRRTEYSSKCPLSTFVCSVQKEGAYFWKLTVNIQNNILLWLWAEQITISGFAVLHIQSVNHKGCTVLTRHYTPFDYKPPPYYLQQFVVEVYLSQIYVPPSAIHGKFNKNGRTLRLRWMRERL